VPSAKVNEAVFTREKRYFPPLFFLPASKDESKEKHFSKKNGQTLPGDFSISTFYGSIPTARHVGRSLFFRAVRHSWPASEFRESRLRRTNFEGIFHGWELGIIGRSASKLEPVGGEVDAALLLGGRD